MSLRSRGAAALTRRLLQSDGVEVTYTRGAQSEIITVWIGNTLFARTLDEPGASVIWGDRDYLIPVASLVIGGTATTPQKGDRITETIDGVPVVFELQTPTGEPSWRHSDQDRTRYRIHTKKANG